MSKNLHKYLQLFFYPCILLLLEIIFNLSTVHSLSYTGLLYTSSFSLSLGLFLSLIVSFFKDQPKKYISILLSIFISIPFIVEFFIYKMFKVFYDFNTMVNGAGGVVGEFMGQVAGMVFSIDGLIHIILYLLPVALTIIYYHNLQETEGKKRPLIIMVIILSMILTTTSISRNKRYEPSYNSAYNFQNAVKNFGLMTGLRLDLTRNLFSSGVRFNEEDNAYESKDSKTYGLNQMDLKFNENADSGESKVNGYVQSQQASAKNKYTGLFKGYNLIFLTCEAFSEEVIDPKLTPTLYRLAHKGIQLNDYYVQSSAGTTGGEFQNIFGLLPLDGGSSFRKTSDYNNYMTMGSQLDRLGYYGLAMHNNTYTFYERNVTHNHIGYSEGFIGMGNGMEKYVTDQWTESDYEMLKGTLQLYVKHEPFNIYAMTVSGHGEYSRKENAMTRKNWDLVKGLDYSDAIKGYLAANIELEKGVNALIKGLDKHGVLDHTVIVMSADHFPYGLSTETSNKAFDELKGYTVETTMQRDHNRAIIWSASLEDKKPIVVNEPSSSLDLLPTLSNLFGTKFDSRLFIGRDVLSDAPALVFNTEYDWKTSLGEYNSKKDTFTPNKGITVDEEYINNMKTIVKNKMTYNKYLVYHDYFNALFKDETK